MSPFLILLELRWWRWWYQLELNTCKAPVKTPLLPRDQHPVAQPTVSKHWREIYVTLHWNTKTFLDQDKTDTDTVVVVAADAVVAVADVPDADAVVAGDSAGLQAVYSCSHVCSRLLLFSRHCRGMTLQAGWHPVMKTKNSLAVVPTSMAMDQSPLYTSNYKTQQNDRKRNTDLTIRKTNHAIRISNHQSPSRTTISAEIGRKPQKNAFEAQ